MSAPRLECCYFGEQKNQQWGRLARVLQASALEQCPAWQVSIERLEPLRMKSARGNESFDGNTQKLEHWTRIVETAPDGERILLIDVDAMIVRPIDPVWDLDFDVAYTVRSGRYPINGGVVFLRVSDAVREFMQTWAHENRRMLLDRTYHRFWQRQYAGINQAAFGAMLSHRQKTGAQSPQLLELPCLEWNCEDNSWRAFDPSLTRILHIKSALRRSIFGLTPTPGDLKPLVKLWREAEARTRREVSA